MIKGIDVSEFQGDVNWKKVKAAGIGFAIVRAGFGSSITQKDACFESNMRGALEAGVDVGAYWFSYATGIESARREARLFSEVMRPYRGKAKYPLYFDYEYDSYDYSVKMGVIPTKRLITDMARVFMDTLEDEGWFAGWYTNQDYYKNRYYPLELAPYTLWLAAYHMDPPFSCAMQQTSSTGSVSGVTGYVDLDSSFEDFPSVIVSAGRNGFPPGQSGPSQGTEMTVTGKWVCMRSGPNTQDAVLHVLDEGTKVRFLRDTGKGWSEIRWGGGAGYMSNLYLSGKGLSAYPTAVNYGNWVNVRSAPSLSGKIIRQLHRGQRFSVISLWSNGWINADAGGAEGFLYYDPSYISL